MRKFVAVACLTLGLAAVPRSGSASPIGTNHCGLNGGAQECDIFADYTGAASALGVGDGNLGGYLFGYTFLLNQGANLSDGFRQEDVAQILVIHDSLFELFSNVASNPPSDLFSSVFNAAIAASLTNVGQIAGQPVPDGVLHFGAVGYYATEDVVSVLANWGVGNEAGQDLLRINTALPVNTNEPPPPSPVPEPGTLSLLAVGGAFVALRRRRVAAKLA